MSSLPLCCWWVVLGGHRQLFVWLSTSSLRSKQQTFSWKKPGVAAAYERLNSRCRLNCPSFVVFTVVFPEQNSKKTCSLSRLNETLQYMEHICITYCRRHSECKLSQNFRQKSMLSLSHVVYWLLMTAGYTSYLSYLSAFLTPNVQLGEAHTYLTTC